MPKKIDELLSDNSGEFPAYAWPGGYPMYYVTADNGVLCPRCANANLELTTAKRDSDDYDRQWAIVDYDANYENFFCQCDECNEYIDPAYITDDELTAIRQGANDDE